MEQIKLLKDLNLMDRFLFAEAMEDPVILQAVLEIILSREIVLKELPQAEKEVRTSPFNRYVKLDVWAQDDKDEIYDTEVQKHNTGNLPKRSRYYQAVIDSKLLEPGEVDFNRLNQVYIIIIASFDLFGLEKYMYTFQMSCEEVSELKLRDGAVRIFLNTKGKNAGEVSPELVELLRYMEHTDEGTSRTCSSLRIHQMQERIAGIKSNEEVGVRYMQEWEEKILDRKKAQEEGWAKGREEGRKEGRKEGMNQGVEEGVKALIEICIEFCLSREETLEKVKSRFTMTETRAEELMSKYWNI